MTFNHDAIIQFGLNSQTPVGIGYMSDDGTVIDDRGAQLWLQGRFTHVYAVESIYTHGAVGTKEATWGVRCLRENFIDHDNGGWFSTIATHRDDNGNIVAMSPRKEAYAHAFVILAAASGVTAKVAGAQELLDEALRVFDTYFWDETASKTRESYANDWSDCEDYRGINANMHTVEAYLAAYDATMDNTYLDRAARICDFVVEGAQAHDWRIHEHYHADWSVDDDYNRDCPAHPFRPWGATVGHGFEWSRLILQTAVSLHQRALLRGSTSGAMDMAWPLDETAPGYNPNAARIVRMVKAAFHLYDRAKTDGWDTEKGGFVYTTDFDGNPIVRERMHWVVCEAINTAVVAQKLLLDITLVNHGYDREIYRNDEAAWRAYAQEYLIESPGRWIHELDANNQPSHVTWAGKPDIYHAYQMTRISETSGAYSFAKEASLSARQAQRA